MNAPLSILQLRLLIRNDEARVIHLTEWANKLKDDDWVPVDFEQQIIRAHEQLAHHRARLEGLRVLSECATTLPPAATPLAGAAVTSAQPAGHSHP